MPFRQLLSSMLNPPPHGQSSKTIGDQFQQPFSWGQLIDYNNQPSSLFMKLLDGIFSHFVAAAPGMNGLGLDPTEFAAAFTALQYSDSNNKVRCFYIFATQHGFPQPEQFVYDVLPMFYRAFGIPYVTNPNGLPVLTREGFCALVLMDTLGDPEVTWRRLNAFMAARGQNILDPETGQSYPVWNIPRDSLPRMPDGNTWERARTANIVFNRELGAYLNELIRIGRWRHDVTMAGMSDGVWIQLVPGSTFY